MRRSTRFFALACIGIIAAIPESHADNVYPYELATAASLGSGFDNSTLDVTGTCVEDNGGPGYVANAAGQKLRLIVHRIETESELKRQMEVSVAAEVKYFGLGLDASMGLAEKMSEGESTTNFLVKLSVLNNVKVMEVPSLMSHAKELLTQGKISRTRFRELCGTEYVVGVETGGYLFALLRMNEVTEEAERNIKSALKLNYSVAGVSAETQENLFENLRKLSTSIHAVRIGGSGAPAMFGDVEQLYAAIREFPAQVKMEGGSPIRFITRGYETLAMPGDSMVFESQLAATTLQTLYNRILQLRRDLASVERILQEGTGTPEWFQLKASRVGELLSNQIEEYRTVVQGCIRSKFQECVQPSIGLSANDRELLSMADRFTMRRPESVTGDMVCGSNLKVIEITMVKGVPHYRPLPRDQWFIWPEGKEGDEAWLEDLDRYKSDKLYRAVYSNRVDQVQNLLRDGFDSLNLSSFECWEARFTADKWSPNLVWSAIFFKRSENMVKLLLEHERFFLPTDDLFRRGERDGRTILHIAILRRVSDQVFRLILEVSDAEHLGMLDRFENSMTHYAVKVGLQAREFSKVRQILDRAREMGSQDVVEEHERFVFEAVRRWLPECQEGDAGGLSASVLDKAARELVELGAPSIRVGYCPWAEDLPAGGLIRGSNGEYWGIEDSMPMLEDADLVEPEARRKF